MMRRVLSIVALCLVGFVIGCGDDDDDLVDSPTDVIKADGSAKPEQETGMLAAEKDADVGEGNPNPPPPEEEIGAQPPDEVNQISQVLDNLREGYQKENIDTYMSAFWEDGFLYRSDLATRADRQDDVVFDDARMEEESARRVFEGFTDIEVEFSVPPLISLNAERTVAEVRHHYRIQGFVPAGQVLEGGFTSWFAEGDNTFTFEARDGEWRITTWSDEAFDEREIRVAHNLPLNPNDAVEPLNKLATTWGQIKTR